MPNLIKKRKHTLTIVSNIKTPVMSAGPRTGDICSRLFKYIQQHTAGFNCPQLGPEHPKKGPECRYQ
jgi:hypothetical protein